MNGKTEKYKTQSITKIQPADIFSQDQIASVLNMDEAKTLSTVFSLPNVQKSNLMTAVAVAQRQGDTLGPNH